MNAATRTRIATRMISTKTIMATTMSATTTVVAKTLPDAVRNTKLYSDDRIYKLLTFPISFTKVALDIWTKSVTSTSSTITAPPPPPPPPPPPFQCFMVDKEEITIIISEYVFKEHFKEGRNNNDDNDNNNNRSNDGSNSNSNSNSSNSSISFDEMGIDYRLITFDDVVLDPNLVGFMAEITKVLASNGNNISVLTYAAYSTDHIFVANKDYTKATNILI
jgi:hypothetical protein